MRLAACCTVFSVTVEVGALACPPVLLALDFILLPPKNERPLPFPGNGRWRLQREAGRRPLTAANNRNNSWNAGGGHKRHMTAMESGTRKRLQRSARTALFREDRRPALWLRVHWQNYGYHGCGERGKQKDARRFQCGIKSEIAGRLGRCAGTTRIKTAGDHRDGDRCPPGLQQESLF